MVSSINTDFVVPELYKDKQAAAELDLSSRNWFSNEYMYKTHIKK